MTVVAVAGGTGLVGRLVVQRLQQGGHEARVLSRSTGVDLRVVSGVAEALAGVEAVVDVTGVTTTSARRSTAFFSAVATTLAEAEQAAGVGHHVLLSILGSERVDFGYYVGKRRQEEVVRAASTGWSLLRATQFFEFPSQLAARPGPLVVVPRMRSQPVAAAEVADMLVALALAAPTGAATELAGPDVLEMPDLTRQWLRTVGSRRRVLPVTFPGKVGRGMAGGGLLPTGDGPRGRLTWEQWLAQV